MSTPPTDSDLLALAAQIVSAHVAHNTVPADTLPWVIQSVFATLSGLEVLPLPAEMPVHAAKRGSGPETGRGRRRRSTPDTATAAETSRDPVAKPARGKRRMNGAGN